MRKFIIISIIIVLIISCIIILPYMIKIHGYESAFTWSSTDIYSMANVQSLQMNENEDFKILILSDLQLNFFSPRRNKKALELAELLIEEHNPDFVVTTGDNVSFIYQGSLVKKLARKIESLNVPWAVVFGNHDSEASVDRNWHGNVYEDAKNSLFEMGPIEVEGVGNYQINILSIEGKIVNSLIMLDSHSKANYETGRDYNYIQPNQLTWYKWVTDGMEKESGRKIPSMLFFHIPLIEFEEAIDDSNSKILFGEQNEDVYCAPISSGLFELILEQGSTSHIFNGHDHINNLSILHKGITMTYGNKSGPCSYHDKNMQGGTLITIKSDSYEIEVKHIYN